MNAFPSSFTRGARLLRDLRKLEPGQRYRMYPEQLSDISVPADPLDRQTPEYLAGWMRDRMPFCCELHRDVLGRWFEIERIEHL